jgi:hypothetical protein
MASELSVPDAPGNLKLEYYARKETEPNDL